MTRLEVESIIINRVGQWSARLASAHATPLLLLGVGHDHNTGDITIFVCDSVTDEQLVGLLEEVIHRIVTGRARPLAHGETEFTGGGL